MVNYRPSALDATFRLLADPIRRAILARLARGDSSMSELAQPFPVSLPTISKHLRVLERVACSRAKRMAECGTVVFWPSA